MKKQPNLPVSLRWYMAGILFTTGISIILFDKTLAEAGLELMFLRFPLAVALGYVIFVFAVRGWLLDLIEENSALPNIFPTALLDFDDTKSLLETTARMLSFSWLAEPDLSSKSISPKTFRGVILMGITLVFFISVVFYLMLRAPIILGKTMKALSIRRSPGYSFFWLRALFSETWMPFTIALILAFCLGSFAAAFDSRFLPKNGTEANPMVLIPYYAILSAIPEGYAGAGRVINGFKDWLLKQADIYSSFAKEKSEYSNMNKRYMRERQQYFWDRKPANVFKISDFPKITIKNPVTLQPKIKK